jgi:hypothetical protein
MKRTNKMRTQVFPALTCGASEWRRLATLHMIAVEKASEEVVANIESDHGAEARIDCERFTRC